jgi:hypothetical protein
MAKTHAAVNAIVATSLMSNFSEGMYLAAKATAPPSNRYFTALFIISDMFNSNLGFLD